ncbi:MAG: hypothetical protein V4490_03920, partial [Pseudomonadota bacterium]
MRVLSQSEQAQVNGAWVNYFLGGVFGLGSYILATNQKHQQISLSGALIATVCGAVTNGTSAFATGAIGVSAGKTVAALYV